MFDVNEPRRAAFVRLAWADDHGPSTAAGHYPANTIFPTRMPARSDRFWVRQSMERAERLHRDIGDDTARLIAAHLHTGPQGALYNFAVDGAIRDQLFDELDAINRHRSYARTWVQALARYCLSREDFGPLPGWRATRGAAWAQRKEAATRDRQERDPDAGNGLLDQEFIRSEIALRLLDAAFALGRTATRMDVYTSGSLVKVLQRTRLAG